MATRFVSDQSSKNVERVCQTEASHQEQPNLNLPIPAAKKRVVGFDCEFVERPPKAFQVDCPVCLLVLREPHQVTCCGYSFCQPCIDRVGKDKKPCPTCNKAEFSVFPNKGLQRSIYEYQVVCGHRQLGCQWVGELGELDKHLNENPSVGRQFTGCEFAEIECNDCGRPFQRQHFKAHQLEQHPFSCEYCHGYESYHHDIVKNHWPVCGFRPVPCPNECGVYPERQNLEHHISKDCPLTVVNCDFHYTGCEVQLPRKDIPAHLAENLVPHMAQLATHNQKKVEEKDQQIMQFVEELRQRIDYLEGKNEALSKSLREKEEEITRLKARQEEDRLSLQTLQLYTASIPVEFTMTDFEKHKRDGDFWNSEPFYTHPHGYKMCICVYANAYGYGEGTHLSVFGNLMRGQFDNHLKWPFQATVTIQLINQLHDKEHHMDTILFDTADLGSRVTVGECSPDGYGCPKFLPHSELSYNPTKNRLFLKDDCLRFRVTQVTDLYRTSLERQCLAIESRVCVPPFEFRVNEFEQLKANNNGWISPSFYTHRRGYRMCVGVDANGQDEFQGTHVTVFLYVMKGEFDNYLKWPFRGDITIQLLNQIEDKGHYEKTIGFTDDTPDEYTVRVTSGERGERWPKPDFIPHYALHYNQVKMCQYLKYDSLHFRITQVKLRRNS